MIMGFPGGSDSEESACSAGDPGSIPGWGRSPGEGNGNPLQCSCPGISRTEEPGGGKVHGVTKSRTRLSDKHSHFSQPINNVVRVSGEQ